MAEAPADSQAEETASHRVQITASSSSSEESIKSLLEVFAPQLYMFKMENETHIKSVLDPLNTYRQAQIICPEFHILLDHTIAVVWMIYSDTKNWSKLAPVHLHWALKFLEGIRNKQGNSPRDINLAINQIQDIILLLYSSYGEKYLDSGYFEQIAPDEFDPNTTPKNKRNKPVAMSTPDMSRFPETVESDEELNHLSPIENPDETVDNKVINKQETTFNTTKNTTTTEGSNNDTVLSSFPISVTLNDMLSTTNPAKLEKLMQSSAQCDPSTLPSDKDQTVQKTDDGDDKEQFCKQLRQWRIEQMKRIESDVSRLVSIEQILKDYGAGTQEDNEKLMEMINKRKEENLGKSGEE